MFCLELGKLDPSDPSKGFIEVILTWLSLTVSSCSSRHPTARLLSLCLFFFTSSNCSGWDGVCLRAYSGGSRPPGPPPPQPRACPPSSPARCTGTARPASSARRTAGDSPRPQWNIKHNADMRDFTHRVMMTAFVDFLWTSESWNNSLMMTISKSRSMSASCAASNHLCSKPLGRPGG